MVSIGVRNGLRNSNRQEKISGRLRRMKEYFSDLEKRNVKAGEGRRKESKSVRLEELLEKINCVDRQPCISDEKLADSWLQIYRNMVDYLSQENVIGPKHIENLGSFEAVSGYFMERMDDNPTLAKRVGGIGELEGVLRKLLSKEYLRIDKELERREGVLKETLEEYLTQEDAYGRVESYQALLGAVDEQIKLKKLCNGSLEEIVELRGVVKGKIEQERAVQKRMRASSKRVELYVEEVEASDNEQAYKEIIRKNEMRLNSIAGRVGEGGVLDGAYVRSLFEVRDSCYGSIAALGEKTPVKEIEEVIDMASERDKRQMLEFIRRCENRGAKEITQKGKNLAEAYRRVLGVWGMYI
jgi:hypothetical protein